MSPAGEELEQHARGKEGRHSDRQPPAVLGAVKAVQLPAHRLRLSHLGHRAGQGLFRAPALRLKGGGLIGNMVGQLPQENPPGPPPADLAAHPSPDIRSRTHAPQGFPPSSTPRTASA